MYVYIIEVIHNDDIIDRYVCDSLITIENSVRITCSKLPRNEQPVRITTDYGFEYVNSKSRTTICKVYVIDRGYKHLKTPEHF